MTLNETVAAVASPPGSALRAMIRISGAGTREVFQRVLGADPFPADLKHATSRMVEVPVADGTLTIAARLAYWPNSRSFTGEPLAELHLPGAVPIVEEVLEQVFVSGARPAERGEFTLRAFLAGRIDLVQAEAVLGVIEASDQQELESALGQLGGGVSGKIASVREQLLLHLADLEAGLDFVEEDIDFVARPELRRRLQEADLWIGQLLEQASARILSSARRRVVLAGLPNAGKSTLFNTLIGRQQAIVSPVAGTTRDYLSAIVSNGGLEYELIDTAGCETTRDEIEAAAAFLRDDQFERADLIVWCRAANSAPEDEKLDLQLDQQSKMSRRQRLLIQTKSDLKFADRENQEASRGSWAEDPILDISAEQGDGIAELQAEIVKRLSGSSTSSEMIGTTAARCAESLRNAREGLLRAAELVEIEEGDELIAIEIREVLGHLGRIVGQVYTDDILDRIFSRFCIGK